MHRRTFLSHALAAGAALTSGHLAGAETATTPRTQADLSIPLNRQPTLTPVLAKRLEPGMTVGVVAPASNAFEDEDIRYALDIVESLGFKPKPGRHLFDRKGYLAGADADRASDLNAMFTDSSVDAVFCARGGYGTMRILPLLDYAGIRANPKVLLGYSDITALMSAIHRYSGLITFHGPIATQEYTPYTYTAFQRTLIEHRSPLALGAPPPFDSGPGRVERENRLQTLVPGQAEGHLIGGNLSLVAALMGTPFEPQFDGGILVLEDVDEAPYRVDRMLTQLKLAGVFSRVNGVVFGKFTDYKVSGPSISMGEVLEDRCGDLQIPVLKGLMIGHVRDQAVIPIGARAELDATRQTLTLKGPYLTNG